MDYKIKKIHLPHVDIPISFALSILSMFVTALFVIHGGR